MHQLRWNAVLQQWIVFATDRQNRPQMPANWCPFDPGSGKVPAQYDVFLYPNDFPGFGPTADPFTPIEMPHSFAVNGPRGACDVVLYSPEHNLPPSKLSVQNWRKVIDVWVRRTNEHAANPDIALVDVFENSGEAVGVTMPHPHGQIYATPFLGPTVEKEVESTRKYAAANRGACLFCHLLEEELKRQERMVASNDHFAVFVPFAARFPAETAIYARRHVRTLLDLTSEELDSLAQIISVMRRKYDNLYGFLLPLMMAVKQAPLKETNAPYHLHVQFLPLQRSATKLKYLATMETGYGVFLADTAPEEMAEHLRNSDPKTAQPL
jgi:UDPglucose--hexose-1-phosphate uridylyltransferase